MKLSEAMLKGYAKVGAQCTKDYCKGKPESPTAVCAAGAVNLALFGNARSEDGDNHPGWHAFRDAYELPVADANDKGLPIDVIAGMLRAIGH